MLKFISVRQLKIIAVSLVFLFLAGILPMTASAATTVWTDSSRVNIFQDTTKPSGASTSISLIAAKNEYEAAQILFRSDTAATISSVFFTNLTSGANTIAASNIQYKFVEYVYYANNTRDPYGDHAIMKGLVRTAPAYFPDALSNDSSVSVSANTTQPIWIKVYIPKTAVAGNYSGTVTVSTTVGNFNVPIAVEVVNVTLPDTKDQTLAVVNNMYNITWYDEVSDPAKEMGPYSYGVSTGSTDWWQIIASEAAAIKEMRQNYIFVPLLDLLMKGGSTANADGTWTFNWSFFDQYIQTFIDGGAIKKLIGSELAKWNIPNINDPACRLSVKLLERDENGNTVKNITGYVVGSTKANSWLNAFIPALKSHLQSKDWWDMWMQEIKDEVRNTTNQRNDYKALHDQVKSLATDMTVSSTMFYGNSTFWNNIYANRINVWVPELPCYENNKTYFDNRQNAGDTKWFYVTTDCLSNTKEWMNRYIDIHVYKGELLFWLAYKYNMEGFLHWAWNGWLEIGDEGDDFCHGEWGIVWPDVERKSIKHSIRSEAMRDGIESFETLKLLEAKDKTRADNLANALVTSGTTFIKDVSTILSTRTELLRNTANAYYNRVKNPGFESVNSYWTKDGGTNGAVNNNARTGSYSMKLNGGGRYQSITSGITPGKSYTVSLYGKFDGTGSSGGTIYVWIYNSSWGYLGEETLDFAGTETSYTQMKKTFTMPANAAIVQIGIYGGDSNKSFYVDDVELYSSN